MFQHQDGVVETDSENESEQNNDNAEQVRYSAALSYYIHLIL